MISQRPIYLRVSLFLLALFLFGYHAWNAGPLWRDEANTVAMARAPLRELWSNLGYDSFPIAYFLLVKFWSFLPLQGLPGDLEWRLLGLLTGLCFLAALALAANGSRQTAVPVALVLVLLNPICIRYVSSVRPYGLSAIAAVLLFHLLHKALHKNEKMLWGPVLFFSLLLMHLHYMNVVLLAGFTVAACVALKRRRENWLLPLGTAAATLISLLPYLPSLQTARSWSDVPVGLGTDASALWRVCAELLNGGTRLGSLTWLGLGVMLVVFAVIGRRNQAAQPLNSFYLALWTGLIASFCLLYLGVGWRVSLWYLVPYFALLGITLICWEDAVLTKTQLLRNYGAWNGAVVLLLVVALLPSSLGHVKYRASNMDRMADFLRQHSTAGDKLIVFPWYLGVSFQHHGDRLPHLAWDTYPSLPVHDVHRYDLLKSQLYNTGLTEDVQRLLKLQLRSGGRVWLLTHRLPVVDEAKMQQLQAMRRGQVLTAGQLYTLHQQLWELELGTLLKQESNAAAAAEVEGADVLPGLENVVLYMFWKK